MSEPIQTTGYWNGAVDSYIAGAEPFTAQFCEDAVVLADVDAGLALLDVATGPGALALAAARAGAVVTAIDFSQAMINRLSARIGELPITPACMDGQALDLPDASFDRACSVFGIPLFPDWRAGLSEMARVLRPGGRAVVGIADNPHGFGPNPLLARSREKHFPLSPAPVDVRMDLVAEPRRLVTEFAAAGFGNIAIEERTHDFVLIASLFTADHPMIAANPMLTGLLGDDRLRVIGEAIEEAHRRSRGDHLLLPGTARFIIGAKS
ncbi:SAM-dependent methyltransferase [Sphingobium xenophagum]|uniref:SAM-dependent methyltransferase n=1 Tax=Sphingobium xenophagum TaxID=121428 RepID=A0ABU1X0W7_SPHXE|nr:methyltransferase domain-containing protein [Sphingobium xenophagum]MDR7154822.1 SAM-dependent methyltransferase [Sphingobium xenophagum]